MQEQQIERLREALEQAVDRKLQTPKDFNFLSDCIFDKLHEHISPTTLKRMWGYINDAGAAPRKSTLDILARFLDYPDWAAFCASPSSSEDSSPDIPQSSSAQSVTPSTGQTDNPSSTRRSSLHRLTGWALGIIAILLCITIPLAIRGLRTPTPNILRQGRVFTCYDDYLKLFGLKSDEYNTYFVRLPSQPYVCFWAPKYHHHVWHNDGDPKLLMPTITEYYHPNGYPTDSASLAQLAQANKENYAVAIRDCEVRVTFMKDLFDSTYVYLGVYRVSSTLSDSTRVVWRRVATDIDLDHLENLSQYRR